MVSVGVEWVQDFPSTGCIEDQLAPDPQNNAEGFLSSMVETGNLSLFDWGDNNAWATDFIAPVFGGDSLNWSDNVNFCYFADHGVNDGTTMSIAFSNESVGCFASTAQMTLGVNNLKWLVLDCCDLVLGTDAASVGSVWFGPTQGVHLVMGFVGISYTGGLIGDFGTNFGGLVGNLNGIAAAWLNEAANWWVFGGNTAIAIACGVDADQAMNRLDQETLTNFPQDVTATNSLAWSWWEWSTW
jgi:hypothetical protein